MPRRRAVTREPTEDVMEAYCVKCRAKSEMVSGQEVTMKTGKSAMKGKCGKCGTGMYLILGSKKPKK